MRVAPELVRAPVRLLRGGEVAATTPDLADLVEAAGRDRALIVLQLLTGLERLLLGSLPVTAEPEHLGAVDAAGSGKAGHVEPVAPAVRLLGPLGRPPVVPDVLAGRDGHAVDDGGREGPQLAAHGGRRRLVEESEPGLELAPLDQCAPLADDGEHLGVPVAKLPAQLEGTVEEPDRLGKVAGREHGVERPGQRQSRVHGALGLGFEQPFRGPEPAARDGEGASACVILGQGERDPRRSELVFCRRVPGVGALPQVDRLVEPAPPPGGLGEAFEIVRGQPLRLDIGVRVVRLSPGEALDRLLGGLQRVGDLRHRYPLSQTGSSGRHRAPDGSPQPGTAAVTARRRRPL